MINRAMFLTLMLLMVPGCQNKSETATEVPDAEQKDQFESILPDAASDVVIQPKAPSKPVLAIGLPNKEQSSSDTSDMTAPPTMSEPRDENGEEPESSTFQQVKEVAVEWIDRQRFWEMTRRTVAARSKQPADLTAEQQADVVRMIEQVEEFFDHYSFIEKLCINRVKQLRGGVVDQLILAGLKGQFPLPPGTRKRRLTLTSTEHESLDWQYGAVIGIRQNILDDNLSKGDLFYLSTIVKSAVLDYGKLREFETKLDEVCLSFPVDLALSADSIVGCGQYSSEELAASVVIREHWNHTSELAEHYTDYHKDLFGSSFGFGATMTELNKEMEGINSFGSQDLESILVLAANAEELGGGSEPLLIFPEVKMPPKRDKLLAASAHQFDIVASNTPNRVVQFRDALYKNLSKEYQAVVDSKNSAGKIDFSDAFTEATFIIRLDEAIIEKKDIHKLIDQDMFFGTRKEHLRILDSMNTRAQLETALKYAGAGATMYFSESE